MEVYNSEEEQVQALKQWWKENAFSIIAGVVLGLGGIFGYQYWGQQNVAEAAAASEIYEQVLSTNDAEQRNKLIFSLTTDFPDTPYASLAVLLAAKDNVDKNKLTDAINNLKWVVENTDDDGVRHVAQQRLARLYISAKDLDAAEEIVKGVKEPAFAAAYAEIKGDINRAKKLPVQARENYRLALAALKTTDQRYPIIKMKLDDLSGSSAQ